MKYLIIGVSAAGMASVKEILANDPQAEIVVVSTDDCIYSRLMMYKVLAGELTLPQSAFEKEEFFLENHISWLRGKTAVSGDAMAKTVTMNDGTVLSYDKLLLATGASPFVPPIPGLREADNAFCFRDLPDLRRLTPFTRSGNHAVIIGGGLVGLDVAYALCSQGVSVALVELADRLLPLQLDAESASAYQQLFEQAGTTFHLGRKAAEVEQSGGWAEAVLLDDGSRLPCDFIVVSAGVRPNLTLAQTIGIDTDRSICVNDRMETSIDGIYAAGDVIGRSGIWQSASEQGAVAGINMSGGNASYEAAPTPKNLFNYFGRATCTIGDVNTPDAAQIARQSGSQSIRIFVKEGAAVAVILTGNMARMSAWQKIIESGETRSWAEEDLFAI